MARAAIHPGEFLADELTEIGMTRTELARQIDVPPNRISQIIRGKRDLTADTALRLGRFFGTGPELWLNLQKAYEIQSVDEETRKWDAMMSQWMEEYPYFDEIKGDLEFKKVPIVFYFDNGKLLH